jgi:hypothetical protein
VNLAKFGDIQNMSKYKIISTLLLLQAIVVIFGGILFFWRFFSKHTGNLKQNILIYKKIPEMTKII